MISNENKVIRPQRLLADSLVVSATTYPDKTALIVEGEHYTYRQLFDSSLKLANALKERGVKTSDRVAIYMDNTWPCVVSIYATLLTGGAFLIINPQTKADKLEYIINDCEAKIILTDVHLENVFNEALNNVSSLEYIICSGTLPERHHIKTTTKTLEIESFDAIIDSADTLTEEISHIANDLAALIYTSGSTGNPKGVMHTHLSMTFALNSIIEYLRLDNDHRILNVLPLAFDYGLYQLLMSIHLGATLILERSFTYPAQVFKRIEENQATVFPGVPTIFSFLLAAHKRKKITFPSISRVTNTAAALPEDFVPILNEIFPNALIYKMYGLTECKRVSFLEPELLQENPGSVGKAIPGTDVFLLSQDGEPVSSGEEGILHVRGPHVMLGYWKQPTLSAKMLKDGWLPGEKVLCTHDWFRQDDDGYLYFVGRSDDIIKTRGEKVSPIEVENILHSISGIKEAAVIGVPDDLLGESIRAYVSLNEGYDLSERELKRICISKLENFMVPSDFVFLPELPKTSTGKISKKELQEII